MKFETNSVFRICLFAACFLMESLEGHGCEQI